MDAGDVDVGAGADVIWPVVPRGIREGVAVTVVPLEMCRAEGTSVSV